MKRTGLFASKSEQRNRVTFAQLVESLALLLLAAAVSFVTLSGQYTLLTTPRAFVYLLIAAVMLLILAVCAACGWFALSARDAWRMLVAIVVPVLLIIIPLQTAPGLGLNGFDRYAGGRAIAIRRVAGALPGLRRDQRSVTVSNDDFGLWYDEIDHNISKYEGYTITLTGFVSRDPTLGAGQFRLSRQLMSCCILDMSPFGFVANYKNAKNLHDREWVRIRAVITRGSIGLSGYQHSGIVLRIVSLRAVAAPTGYFYRP